MLLQRGSGKTAVLVERIINKVINEKIDIDKILVVTFTNAAASEMRERILEAIYKKLEENPDNYDLQRQITLLNKSNICTIHSFCLDVIKNNFYEIEISPNFRIGDDAEIELLKQEVLEDLFEAKYMENDKDFLKLIDVYTGYRGDEPLKELILSIYKYIQSSPFPEEWLNEKIETFNLKNFLQKDFSETSWGKILLNTLKDEVEDCIIGLKSIKKDLDKTMELDKYSRVISSDIEQLEEIIQCNFSWNLSFEKCQNMSFAKWPSDRKIVSEIKDKAKDSRDKLKKKFNSVKDKFMLYDSEQANQDIYEMYEILILLKNIILEFTDKFLQKKLEKNLIDFNDIEHFALKILVTKDENGKYIPTEAAKKYKEKFKEIAIDEYQDSNLVQEYILTTVSKGDNIFMVGDVKQSIYKFRQARPELFLEKYENYKLKDNQKDGDNLKIQLFKNFRSRKNILDITNLVFENIMSKKLGDIDYNEVEYLNLGADYKEPEEKSNIGGIAELNIIDLKEEKTDDEDVDENEKQEEIIEKTVIEAKFVAKKIKSLLENENYKVYDKKNGYRNITYKDIVVLLRATSEVAPIYEKEIMALDLPVFSDTSTQYLESIEIQTIMSLLKVIDNPMQDIPLVTVLRSIIGGFSDNELVEIRLKEKNTSFYESMIKAKENVDDELKNKIENFLNKIKRWRKKQEYLPLDELIWNIYIETGYMNYVSLMPNGILRQANLKMLFERAKQYENASFKGLFNFISFIDKLRESSGDLGAAKLIGENENVIRIMSIHKSKGLEFPVVFLCGMGKMFNMIDLNNNILLHQELGLGPKYINYERKIEYNTLAKEAIKIKAKQETISEEMRVLYVALTRSKEKLIMTGISKDIEKAMKEKQKLLDMYNNKDKISSNIIGRYKSYLDWMQLVYLYNKEKIDNVMNLNIYTKKDAIDSDKCENLEIKESIYEQLEKENISEEECKYVEKMLEWKYKYHVSTNIPSKTSVTKIKQMEKESIDTLDEILNKKPISMTKVPNFLKDKIEVTSAQKGTLIHMCLQRLNEKEEYDITKIKELISKMVEKELISQKEANAIDVTKILKFTKSELWKNLKNAKKVYKERPFYININAKDIYKDEKLNEKILVQGIIDLYYIDQDGKIVLVDYKTDYVKRNEEQLLIEKYRTQLELYKKALEQSTNMEIKGVYIYSTCLEKLITLQ